MVDVPKQLNTIFLSIVFVVMVSGCVEKQVQQGNEEIVSKPQPTVEVEADKKNEAIIKDLSIETEKELLNQLPEPEKGFSWTLFKGVAIQRPESWNEYTEGNTYTSSVESVPEKGMFETGLTVQVVPGIQKKHGMSAFVVAARLVNSIDAKEENTELLLDANEHPDMKTIVYRYRNAPPELVPIIVHKYFQISEAKDSINIITFETTEEQWDRYWKQYGEVMLGNVGVYSFE